MMVNEPLSAPVPLNATEADNVLSLGVIESVAESDPTDCGLKTTEMVQFAPAATEEPQLLKLAKLVPLVPEVETVPSVTAAPVLFVKVNVWAVLQVATFWLPNVKDVDETSPRALKAVTPRRESTERNGRIGAAFFITAPILYQILGR
jgi:hypothetical protein